MVTDCGLSLLVPPTFVEAKLNDGGCERFTSTIWLLPLYETKISPAPSTATPYGASVLFAMIEVWAPEVPLPRDASCHKNPLMSSATKISLAPSTAPPVGDSSPLSSVVWTPPGVTSTTRPLL